MSQEEILKTIPHRPPFLFVDEVVEIAEEHAITRLTIKPDFEFFQGHYPGNPIMPGVLLCEAVFQSAAVFLVKKFALAGQGADELTRVLSRITDARFKSMVKPGDVVDIRVAIKETLGKFYFMKGVVTKDGKKCLTIDYALALLENDSAK